VSNLRVYKSFTSRSCSTRRRRVFPVNHLHWYRNSTKPCYLSQR